MHIVAPLEKKVDDFYSLAIAEKKLSEYINYFKDHTILQDAITHHFISGGSRTRARLTFLFSKNLGLGFEDSVVMSCVPELFHNASLIHDDLQDSDYIRRGEEAVWNKFGPDVAICIGDFLISAAYACIADLSLDGSTRTLIKHVHVKIAELIRGQMLDLRQSKDQSLDDLLAYENIAAAKSGPLFSLSLTLPLIAKGHEAAVQVAETVFRHFAIAYQILDDIGDFRADQSKKGIKSGVNIITLLKKTNILNPQLNAVDIALNHLQLAREILVDLPFSCQHTVKNEIERLEESFKDVTLAHTTNR